MFVHDAGTAQQCLEAEQQFGLIRRFGHVVIGAHQKAGVLILWQSFRRKHQDRQHTAAVPDGLRQCKTIHPWHHDIAQQQVDVLMVQRIQRCLPVEHRHRLIAVPLQDGTQQLVGAGVVLCDQDSDHRVPLLFVFYYSSVKPTSSYTRKINKR